ncbi:hypothetical protein DXG03_001929 [Asterophora parasitica]|uniref:Extracellular serine-rich protein n=1 Tax=Asterophora parasitica TaxID=117018 RepID=A0A9P7G2J9_9AGAR|nr:hypothetical protein DXG03_001929 [Asterophora parasitica]
MQYLAAAVSALTAAAVASAANIQVLVGSGGLTFTPTSVIAAAGDTINFEFVTQSTFAKPCDFLTTPNPGVDSGFQAVAAGATDFPAWSITIDDPSTPLWFFCAQTNPANHCQAGMVFAVNPTAEKSFDAYLANAKASTPDAGAPAPGGTGPASSGAVPGASESGALPTSAAGAPTVVPTVAPPAPTTVAAPPASSGAAGNSTASPEAGKNGATRLGGGASMLLALAGLVAGLML